MMSANETSEATEEELSSSLNAFEAAVSAKEVALDEVQYPELMECLWALDGSNQDEATAGLMEGLVKSGLVGEVHVCFPYEGEQDEEKDTALLGKVDALRALESDAGELKLGALPESREFIHPERRSFEQVLDHRMNVSADMVVMPAPFFEDFWKLGQESVGVHLDMMMARCPKPMLILRDPELGWEELGRRVVMPFGPMLSDFTSLSSGFQEAGVWLMHWLDRVSGAGELVLLAQQEGEAPDLSEAKVAGWLGAMQQKAKEKKVSLRVAHSQKSWSEAMKEETEEGARMSVLVYEKDGSKESFQRAAMWARLSQGPVFLFPV